MAYKLQIAEILNKLKELPSDAHRAAWLRQNDSPTLRMLFQHNFDPTIKYNLPDGVPPFSRNDAPIGHSESTLFAETRKLGYLWLVPSDSALKDATQTQQTQLDQIHAIQEERGKAYQAALAEEILADKEIQDAREAIDAAKARLNKAIQTSQFIKQTVAGARHQAQQADFIAQRVEQGIEQNINEIHKRENKPTNPQGQRLNLPKYRLEGLFISLLESLCGDEADVLIAVKNKALGEKFPVTPDLVNAAFPGLVPPAPVSLPSPPPRVVDPVVEEVVVAPVTKAKKPKKS